MPTDADRIAYLETHIANAWGLAAAILQRYAPGAKPYPELPNMLKQIEEAVIKPLRREKP